MKGTIAKFNRVVLAAGCCAAAALGAGGAQAVSTDAAIASVRVGELLVYSLVDSPQVFAKTLFEGIDAMPERLEKMPEGKYAGVVKTYFVQVDGRNVLFDAGWGTDFARKGGTRALLDKLGVKPESVTDVLITHMDGDHISGLFADGLAAYPKARLHVARLEYGAWMDGKEPKTQKNALARRVSEAYKGRIKLFDYDEEVIKGITAKLAAGHTPGHTIYEIDSNGSGMTIVGDLMHVTPIQMRWTDYSTAYDGNPEEASRVRESVLEQLSRSGRIMAGMHFEQMGKVRKAAGGGYEFVGQGR